VNAGRSDLPAPAVDLTVDWQLADRRALLAEGEISDLLRHALEREGQGGAWEIAIRFVNDAEIARAHEMYLGDPSPTDIMTFPYDDDDVPGGDILISVDTADANAMEHGWVLDEELRFLVLHGLLHILGWEDDTPDARARMLERQGQLLAEWHVASGR